MTNSMEETAVRRSSLERGLTMIAIFGFLLCIVLAIALAILAVKTKCNIISRTSKCTLIATYNATSHFRYINALFFEKHRNKISTFRFLKIHEIAKKLSIMCSFEEIALIFFILILSRIVKLKLSL
ncbi:PREDICTED: uncharacterized protein LOC105460305 [Wasmannia auropunctata]|uniref:uncharacterized protein LOC105460305 n=1 Tax=Wasmannia auropunctata TaxID=64793 RepID=UPI0005ED5C2E|nr:PREDICTED: uncharacterized protein LOC105460305 [Wasmannia auropunctata]